MVFIQTCNQESAEYRQNRSPAPESPMPDGHAVNCLPPAVEESETHEPVAYEVAGLTDEMVYFIPTCRVDWTKEPHPQGIKPVTGVCRRHRGRGLKNDHENAQGGREPIQYSLQNRL